MAEPDRPAGARPAAHGVPPGLDALQVLALDCQATGATPRHGSVIEMAWARLAAASTPREPEVTHHLVALPDGQRVPR
ncbi:MAG TPA: hypothetical protein VND93_20945, partial [Myxococcales bacterium]|nr:hypothetical protein [Myxococcales bacterium]